MSGALLFGLGGALFSSALLAWMLKHKRTPQRGIWRASVTASEWPVIYWGKVAFVGFFLIICLALAAGAMAKLWN